VIGIVPGPQGSSEILLRMAIGRVVRFFSFIYVHAPENMCAYALRPRGPIEARARGNTTNQQKLSRAFCVCAKTRKQSSHGHHPFCPPFLASIAIRVSGR
jgi:hypothetical protein